MIRVDLTKRKFEKKPTFMDFLKANNITETGNENAVAFKVILKGASWGRDFEAQTNTDENKLQLTIETEDGAYRDYLTIYRFKNDGKWNGFASSQISDIMKMLGVDLNGLSSTGVKPEHFDMAKDGAFAVTAYLDEFQGKLKVNIAASLTDWAAVLAEPTSSSEDLI